MILVAVIVVALFAVAVLLCLLWCWDEPVRRGGTVDLTGARPKTKHTIRSEATLPVERIKGDPIDWPRP